MIVDSHIHSSRALRSENIFKACFIPKPESFEPSELERSNDYTRAMADRFSGLVGFATVNPGYGLRELDRAVREMKLGGLVLDTRAGFSFSQDSVWRLLEEVEEEIPVFIHSEPLERGFAVSEANEVVLSFPGINFIFAHLGTERGEEFPRIVSEPNVYYETSEVSREKLCLALESIPSERILFGSHAGDTYPEEEIEKIDALPLSWEEKQEIFYSNMGKLLGLEIPGEGMGMDFSRLFSKIVGRFQ